MGSKRVRLLIMALSAVLTTAYVLIPPKPTVLVARVGMTYDEVVKRSSYPSLANAVPPTGETGFAAIYVSKPAVIIQYDDPQHGFALPPTKFAALTFGRSILESISTSPMLKARRFPETVELLAQLQERFRAGGWVPWAGNQSVWFDLSPAGRTALHAELMRYTQAEQWLVVPHRQVGMIFRIKCVDDCEDEEDARFLIDIGVGNEVGD